MFTHFDQREQSVHYPEDRKFYIGLGPNAFVIIGLALLITVGTAWAQYLVYGLPRDPSLALLHRTNVEVKGFPWWLILCHWVNFFFLMILIRSGLSILFDHPRLYFNNGCRPGSEWVRFTPKKVPREGYYTAKDDARYISPLVALPGYRHSVGTARGWHFIHVPFFVLTGIVFIVLLFASGQWSRVVPTSWSILPDAWDVFVHYATFHMPVEPNGFYHYNALQKLAYFGVVFLLAPMAMLSGMCMSPAIENRFPWLPRLLVNRQGARSVHFLVMFAFVVFTVVHVGLVAATGLVRNMNHITLGVDDPSDTVGLYIGAAIMLFTAAFFVYAHWVSWNRPRWVQGGNAFINGNLWQSTINKLRPRPYFSKGDISPYFWRNGKLPTTKKWKDLAGNGFRDYRLKIGGSVENPIELSLEDLRDLGREQNITMHHCVQGWSGVAEWGGVPLRAIIDLVRPHPSARTVVFYSFGEGLYGGTYYDTHSLENCLKPRSILAWEMNYETLPVEHGAPLRLRVENQLGYKMVKWIERIEFRETYRTVGKGHGGTNEDDEYFDLLANS